MIKLHFLYKTANFIFVYYNHYDNIALTKNDDDDDDDDDDKKNHIRPL